MTFRSFSSSALASTAILFSLFLAGCTHAEPSPMVSPPPSQTPSAQNEKEFHITSFTEIIDGQYHPQFSQKEIRVKKGDHVKIYITVTSGMHDFKIDEYNVYTETPLNKEVMVEFTADKAGEFVYYCTKPGHRALGHWGTLIVEE